MDVTVGQELPPFVREAGFPAWNRYAAVNDEFIPIHMEDAAGTAAGYSGAFGMGNLQWAYLHCLLREWLAGTDGRIVKVQCQFRLASEQHHTVTAKGVVTGSARRRRRATRRPRRVDRDRRRHQARPRLRDRGFPRLNQRTGVNTSGLYEVY